MRFAVVALLWFTGCHHCMQTRPSCSLEPYALIEFINRTDTHKSSYVQRIYDGKPLGSPIRYSVKPRTIHRYRVYPGVYEFGVLAADGTQHSWMTARALWACETVPVMMELDVPEVPELKIKSRRQQDETVFNWSNP